MSQSNTVSTPAKQCDYSSSKMTIYWDYETMPLNKNILSNFSILLTLMKSRFFFSIGHKLPINIKLYIHSWNITNEIQNTFDHNGIDIIQIPTINFNSISKKLTFDAINHIQDLNNHNTNTLEAIGLISSNINFENLLLQLKETSLISHIFLILLHDISMNDKLILSEHVDDIFQINCQNNDDDKHVSDAKIEDLTLPKQHNNVSNIASNIPVQTLINYPISAQNSEPYIYNPYIAAPIATLPLYFPMQLQYDAAYSTYLNPFGVFNPLKQCQTSLNLSNLMIPLQNAFVQPVSLPAPDLNYASGSNSSPHYFYGQQQSIGIDTVCLTGLQQQIPSTNDVSVEIENKQLEPLNIANDIDDISMELTFCNKDDYPSTQKVIITVSLNTLINSIKEIIKSKYMTGKYSESGVYLLLTHKTAETNGTKVEDYWIFNEDTIAWYWTKYGERNQTFQRRVTMNIQQMNNALNTFTLKWKAKNHIHNIREQVHKKYKHLNVPRSAFKLVYNGIELIDKNIIAYYNMGDVVNILWYIDDNERLNNSHITLTLHKMGSSQSFSIKCIKNITVTYVKSQIKQNQNVSGGVDLIIKHHNRILMDQEKIDEDILLQWDWNN